MDTENDRKHCQASVTKYLQTLEKILPLPVYKSKGSGSNKIRKQNERTKAIQCPTSHRKHDIKRAKSG